MLEEVFFIIGFSVYFDFYKNMKTNRINKMAAPLQSFFACKIDYNFLISQPIFINFISNFMVLKALQFEVHIK